MYFKLFVVLIHLHSHKTSFKPAFWWSFNIVSVLFPAQTFSTFNHFVHVFLCVCVVGYQRELTYKHDDGSYSAFGKSDESGNTWSVNLLTARVMFASDRDTTDGAGLYRRKQILHSLVLWTYLHILIIFTHLYMY